MKKICFLLLVFLAACNPLNEINATNTVINCEIPNIPYGAPAVKTKLRVDSNGKVKEVILTHSSGSAEIDQAALKSIETCRIEANSKKDDYWISKDFNWTENIGRH
jgi:TonB family protein